MKYKELNPIPRTVLQLFLEHPDMWTRGTRSEGAFDEHGNPCETQEAARCCLGAALSFIIRKGEPYDRVLHSDDIDRAIKKTLTVINALPEYRFKHFPDIPSWNDKYGTIEKVIEVCKKAGI